jgi:hypothetical protein
VEGTRQAGRPARRGGLKVDELTQNATHGASSVHGSQAARQAARLVLGILRVRVRGMLGLSLLLLGTYEVLHAVGTY